MRNGDQSPLGDRDFEARVCALARKVYIASRATQYDDDRLSPEEAFEEAEKFEALADARWDKVKK